MVTPRFAEISYVFTEKIQSDASRFVVEGVSHNFRSLGRLLGDKINFSYGIPHGGDVYLGKFYHDLTSFSRSLES